MANDSRRPSRARQHPIRVLLVAGDRGEQTREHLASGGLDVRAAGPEVDIGDALRRTEPGAVFLGAELDPEKLARLVREVKSSCSVPCAVIGETFDAELLGLAIRTGADTVFVRDWDPRIVQRLAGRRPPPRASGTSDEGPASAPPLPIAASEAMREAWRLTIVAAESDASVVITGETGTGKEVIARALHRFSPRRDLPFVALNCAAVPETLLESELFGHERGAFTGAETQRPGTFERAGGGTIVLDEIGEMPLSVQAKLLRVLQERSFQRLGGSATLGVDARVVAATNRSLRDEVSQGRFRADLFYRLCGLSIHVPPLRERRADLRALWDHYIAETAAQEGREPPATVPSLKRWLMQYDWPGNVRELQNIIRHILLVTTGETMRCADLPDWVVDKKVSQVEGSREHGLAGLPMSEVERAAILETYHAFGTIRGTAQSLGISARKVQYRLKEYREQGYLATKPRPGAETTAGEARRIRVLLAEDDDELRWALAGLLDAEGYEVIAVRDGHAFLEQVGVALLLEGDEAPIDVIITDLRMPGANGLEILRSVRRRGWEIPVVVTSAFGDPRARAEAEALGATAFLDKPLDLAALQQIMHASMH